MFNIRFKQSIIFIFQIFLILISFSIESDLWNVVFYTGRQFFSGSNLEVSLQLIGELRTSKIINLNTEERKVSGGIIKELISVDGDLGELRQLMVSLRNKRLFFSDWNLHKIDLVDNNNVTYSFLCNCWLTLSAPKRILNVTAQIFTDSTNNNHANSLDRSYETRYPLTIGLLTLLTFIIIFTYLINVLCKKWQHRINWSNYNRRNLRMRRTQITSNSHNNNNDQIVFSVPQTHLSMLNQNLTSNQYKEDKPPDYTELFPNNCNQENSNNRETEK